VSFAAITLCVASQRVFIVVVVVVVVVYFVIDSVRKLLDPASYVCMYVCLFVCLYDKQRCIHWDTEGILYVPLSPDWP
jgi:hypothetical protein